MQSFPFDSQVTYDEYDQPAYDRAVSSQPLRKLIRDLFTTGVMPNPSTCFQVSAGLDGMTVNVGAGFAVIDGGLCQEAESRTLEITAADQTYDRIDTVVLRWDENVDVRAADLYVVAGVPSSTPLRPELQRDNSIYEIGLADIFVNRRTTSITNEKITDTRYESARCGIVSSVSEWDTTTIYQQVQADLASFKADEQAEFLAWYDTIKDMIDELTAEQLQSEIDGLDTRVEALEDAGEGVTSFNTRTGAVTLTIGDVTGALGYTPPTQDTTYNDATQSVHGLMSAADKTKLDGVATGANKYTLPLAASGTRGGVQIGYSESGTNYAVKLSSEKAYVNVPWTDTKVTQTLRTSSSYNKNYQVLAAATDSGTSTATATESAIKSTGVTINPYSGNLNVTKINGVTVGSSPKFTDTTTTSGITRTATTYVPGTTAEASLVQINKTNVFNVKTASWATDATYGFKYTISTTEYTANSSPMWMMCSYTNASTVPTETELTEGAKVLVAMFTASDITLYAKEKPSVNLKLLVKGV